MSKVMHIAFFIGAGVYLQIVTKMGFTMFLILSRIQANGPPTRGTFSSFGTSRKRISPGVVFVSTVIPASFSTITPNLLQFCFVKQKRKPLSLLVSLTNCRIAFTRLVVSGMLVTRLSL